MNANIKYPLFFFACCVLLSIICNGQNLVINPSFEDTVQCPFDQNQVSFATGWDNYSNLSPDYFNSCSANQNFSVPNNWGGGQVAKTGNAYCAVGTYYSGTPDGREFIGSMLTKSLNIGTEYYFSMYVSLALNNSISINTASNNIGALLTTQSYSSSFPLSVTNYSHVKYNNIISDSINWILVSGSFVADSTYQYLVIGNLFSDMLTDTVHIATNSEYFSYYYVDDVCLSDDSTDCDWVTGVPKNVKQEKKFTVFPNPTMGRVTISSETSIQNLIVLNSYGQLVMSNSGKNTIDISKLLDGLYTLIIQTDLTTTSQKIILSKTR